MTNIMTDNLWIFVTLTIIGAIITIENLLVCFVVFRYRNLRTFTNGFIVSLAFSDALFGGVLLPLELADKGSAKEYIKSIILQANVFNLLAVTFDRYLAVLVPLRYLEIMDKHFLKLPLAAWITPVLISLIPISWKNDFHSVAHRVFLFCILILGIVIPYVLILCIYVRIFREVARLVKSLAATAMQNYPVDGRVMEERGRVHSEARVTRIFAVIAAIFVVSWMPVIYMTTVFALQRSDLIPQQLETISWFTLVIGSFLNAPIYAFFKADFRKTITRMICRKKRARSTWRPEDCSQLSKAKWV